MYFVSLVEYFFDLAEILGVLAAGELDVVEFDLLAT